MVIGGQLMGKRKLLAKYTYKLNRAAHGAMLQVSGSGAKVKDIRKGYPLRITLKMKCGMNIGKPAKLQWFAWIPGSY